MKKFQRLFVGVGVVAAAICSVATVAPAANAADGAKTLVVVTLSATRSISVDVSSCDDRGCVGTGGCRALPAHNSGGALAVSGVSLYNGYQIAAKAYNSGNCSGTVTHSTGQVTVHSNNNEFWLDVH